LSTKNSTLHAGQTKLKGPPGLVGNMEIGISSTKLRPKSYTKIPTIRRWSKIEVVDESRQNALEYRGSPPAGSKISPTALNISELV
jgi:hypothetical protein